jgi:hypothetical protein
LDELYFISHALLSSPQRIDRNIERERGGGGGKCVMRNIIGNCIHSARESERKKLLRWCMRYAEELNCKCAKFRSKFFLNILLPPDTGY